MGDSLYLWRNDDAEVSFSGRVDAGQVEAPGAGLSEGCIGDLEIETELSPDSEVRAEFDSVGLAENARSEGIHDVTIDVVADDPKVRVGIVGSSSCEEFGIVGLPSSGTVKVVLK